MKSTFFFLLILFSNSLEAQNVTIDELVSLRKKGLVNVEEILTSKGWSYIDGTNAEFLKLGSAIFAYKKSSYDDKAESFISYYYSHDNFEKKLVIQLTNKEKYLSFINRIKALGCKLIASEMSDGTLVKIYQGLTTTFKIEVSTHQEESEFSTKTVYHFTLIDNKIYNFLDSSPAPVDTLDYEQVIKYKYKQRSPEKIISYQKVEKSFYVYNWIFEDYKTSFDSYEKIIMTYPNKNTYARYKASLLIHCYLGIT